MRFILFRTNVQIIFILQKISYSRATIVRHKALEKIDK
jgi:hypothetical protein